MGAQTGSTTAHLQAHLIRSRRPDWSAAAAAESERAGSRCGRAPVSTTDYDAQQTKIQSESKPEQLTKSQGDWQVRKINADAQASIVEFKNARDHDGRLLHPHFDTIRHEMEKLIQQASNEGVSLTLEQAYYIAIANMGLDQD